jgi:hypothetical protein
MSWIEDMAMVNGDRQAHWENVYRTKSENEVSWFQTRPNISLDLIKATGVKLGEPIIDIGGGASRLVDALLDERFTAITVLDLSEASLARRRSVSVREHRPSIGSSLT